MKFKYYFLFFFKFFVFFQNPYRIINCHFDELIKHRRQKNIDTNYIPENIYNNNLKDGRDDILVAIARFIEKNTNTIKGGMSPYFFSCLFSIILEKYGNYESYLGMAAFSGKGLSDLGLQEECLRNNYIYYLLTYDYINGSFVTFNEQNKAFLFFQQNTFYTGICLTRGCNRYLNFLFNETLDDIFYEYLKKNLSIENAKVYDIGKVDNASRPINPYATYDEDGKYNPEKTKNEENKYNEYNILQTIVFIILSIQFIISLIIHIFYKPYMKAKELRNEIEDGDSSIEQEEENNESSQIFGNEKEEKEKEQIRSTGGIAEFLYNYFSMFNNIKILLKKKSQYYNDNNLEIICFFRIVCMLLITFINNFEVLIKIPSKDFFDEKFYRRYTFFILKFASFSVDVWICLDGFESMYKLINYYKKYIFSKNKTTMSFKELLIFYLYSFYKVIAFFIFFLIVNYYNKYFIYAKSDMTLFEYYSNHIYNDSLENKQFKFLIPGYIFYYTYYKKSSIYDESIISKFSLLIINEFHVYTIFLLIFYISNLLKSKLFDYILLVLNVLVYLANYWICRFKPNEKTYYTYKLVLDNFLTSQYPHILFNYFFFGAMAGLTCFYFKDSLSNNSFSNDNENSPFRFCYHSIKFFDYLIQNGRIFWIILALILQVVLSFSFNFLVTHNDTILMSFNTWEKIVSCYESGLFVLLFCFIIILIYFIKDENKSKNYSSFFFLIERINFSFLICINLILYSYYCFFYFQLKLNYQNLWIVTFGLFFIVCFENLILTLAFVFLFKMINKKIIRHFLAPEEKNERFTKKGELLERSTASELK